MTENALVSWPRGAARCIPTLRVYRGVQKSLVAVEKTRKWTKNYEANTEMHAQTRRSLGTSSTRFSTYSRESWFFRVFSTATGNFWTPRYIRYKSLELKIISSRLKSLGSPFPVIICTRLNILSSRSEIKSTPRSYRGLRVALDNARDSADARVRSFCRPKKTRTEPRTRKYRDAGTCENRFCSYPSIAD